MRIYRPSYTKPLPPGSKVKKDRDGPFIILTDREGFRRKARIRETEKGRRMVVESPRYTVVFRDHNDIERRVIAYRDKASSDQLGQQIAKLVYHHQSRQVVPVELQQWADTLPDDLHQRLASFGLLKRYRAVVSQTLEDMLQAFEEHLVVKKRRNERYAREVLHKCRRVFAGCGFERFTDIDDVLVDRYLLGLRKSKSLATRTLNSYLKILNQFCRFAIRTLKAGKANPLECLDGYGSPNADVRRQRRALTADEIAGLLRSTAASPETRFGMDGPERALLYRFALTTGLRANEIRQLRVECFDFDGPDGPVVFVAPEVSKHRERDILPLHSALVPRLKGFIAERGKTPGAKVFGGYYVALTDKSSLMLRADLVDAQIERETYAGVVDFHALRHTYVSHLREVASRIAQGLARHKSSQMTDHYCHRELVEQRAALEQVTAFGLAG